LVGALRTKDILQRKKTHTEKNLIIGEVESRAIIYLSKTAEEKTTRQKVHERGKSGKSWIKPNASNDLTFDQRSKRLRIVKEEMRLKVKNVSGDMMETVCGMPDFHNLMRKPFFNILLLRQFSA
jgi:hypothetical protein